MKRIRSFLVLVFLCHYAAAQQPEIFTPNSSPNILIDRFKKKTDAPIPFDRSFTLQYPLEKDELFKVHVYRVKVSGKIKTLDMDVNREKYLKSWDTVKNVLLMNIKGIPPNTLIDIAVLRKLYPKEMDTIMAINERLYESTLRNDTAAISGMFKYFTNYMDCLKSKEYGNPPFQKISHQDYKKIFNEYLMPRYRNLKEHNYLESYPRISPQEINYFAYKLSINKIQNNDLLLISQLVNDGSTNQLFNNRVDIHNLGADPVRETDYAKRLVRLDSAVSVVKKVLILCDKLQMLGTDKKIDDLRHRFSCWLKKLNENLDVLGNNLNKITAKIKDHPGITVEEWLIAGNEFNDLEKLSKFVIMPDVGLATLALNGHKGWKFYPRPFVGINVYFRPVDKSLPEADFPRFNLMRIMSFQLGLTYGDLGNKEFSNLFNDFSLMLGPSFRFNRWFRLGTGTVLTTQTDINPIISDTHTHFGGYFAFSFDLDIFSSAASVKSRIFK
ncbi:hypothetical protein OQX61_08980 [Pedobacter sp. PLR]|uniref:hypothetical protein n=1 Tax=Pedobacter sp. PLR TaxID=2994465 RepID=UPI00224653A0|nr:hypothetical protein [Pedobacter sp. PLR]MCX2451403.1 hypothetical protein [Pedobacter sp. PLR]